VFEAPSAGEFYVYYLRTPYRAVELPDGDLPAPQATADLAWLRKHGLDARDPATWTPGNLPAATVVEFQAIEPLHSFFPIRCRHEG